MDLSEITQGTYFRHPWELARTSGVLSLISRDSFEQIADIGAGDLYFLKNFLRQFPGKAYAVDSGYPRPDYVEGITLLTSLKKIPPGSVDIGFLMDVLEHEEYDGKLLAETIEKIKPGGLIIVTVPACPSLFSPHDQFLKHVRRYSRPQLLALAVGREVSLLECFSFFTIPLLIRFMQVALSKLSLLSFTNLGIGGWPLAESHSLTKLITFILKVDFIINRALNRTGIHTIGLSICLILQKKSA